MTRNRCKIINHRQRSAFIVFSWITLILVGCRPSHDIAPNDTNRISTNDSAASTPQPDVLIDRVFLSEIDSLGYVKLSGSTRGGVDTGNWVLAEETVSKEGKFACRVYYRKESDSFKLAIAQYFQDGTSCEVSLAQDNASARFVWSNWYETKIGPFLVLLVAPDPHDEYLLVISPDTRGTGLQARFHYFSPPHASPLLEHVHIDKESVCITEDGILSYDARWSSQIRGVSRKEHLDIPLVIGFEALKWHN